METVWKGRSSLAIHNGLAIRMVILSIISIYIAPIFVMYFDWSPILPYIDIDFLENIWVLAYAVPVICIFIYLHALTTTLVHRFEIRGFTLYESMGIFNRKEESMSLHKVYDFTVTKPFFMRLFGLGTVTLYTFDETNPRLSLLGMRRPTMLRDKFESISFEAKKVSSSKEIFRHDQ